MTLPDIPRLYTALAEILAVLVYAQAAPPRAAKPVTYAATAGWAAVLGVFLQLTGSVPLAWWLPCMVAAIAWLYLYLWGTREMNLLEAGYSCARAFILAELTASVEWQLHCVLWPQQRATAPLSVLLLVAVYTAVYGFLYWFERRHAAPTRLTITAAAMLMAVVMAVTAFAVSNLSFISDNGVTMSVMSIFYIRTLVDMAGVLILTVQHEQLREAALHSELTAMDNVLRRQYEQYRQSKENIRLINRRYHELKMQIAAIRAERHPSVRGREQDRQPCAGHAADGENALLPAARHQSDLCGGRYAAALSDDRGDLHDCGHGAGQRHRECADRARPREAADPGRHLRAERLCDAAV